VGGGRNHRGSLSEGVLIKENHIRACGGLGKAVAAMQRAGLALLQIEVEATTRAEVEAALAAGAQRILLDNMSVGEVREMVELVHARALLEVSGGVSLESVRRLAETGVDAISVGRITHSAPGVDVSMLVRDVWTGSAR
jgi:nicotinate-nucleotide pyrophosphorylase (carboxylating)